ncbi:HAMP domain-containing sensor histidine kinase [Actinoplanes sp. N902-109]|uniref:ATP-binding protein n=1 Tax=Actinoplanes sp. (strain N902-109) TaxID=649831 RepID=UPI0003294261|nr:HAMP domain-containing sensor histidine kinase [Actinoplanes sp. N902-109]AGL15899.1 histidine kinase [Actinoplanes sp. N902-109]
MNITRWIGAPGRRAVALAAAVLAAGLGTGAAAATGLAASAHHAATAELALRTASVRSALETTFQRYEDTLHDAVVTFPSRPFVAGVDAARLPGAHQIVLISPGYAVLAQRTLDGSTPPPDPRLQPPPPLVHSLELARRTGRLTVTPAHVLPADLELPPAHRQQAFELIAPVHDTAFRGWAMIGVRADDLLRSATQGVPGVAVVLAEATGSREIAAFPRGSTGGSLVDIATAGYSWQARVTPTTPLTGSGLSLAAPLSMLGAATLSLLLAGAVLRSPASPASPSGALPDAAPHAGLTGSAAAAVTPQTDLTGFAAAAGDSLRAPLHTIAGCTDLLLEEAAPQLDEAARGFLQRIDNSTRRLLTTVDELLTYAEAGDAALKLEPVDATTLTLDVVAGRLDRLPEATDRPSIDVRDLPAVMVDAHLYALVMGHLVDNALGFVRPGSPARVTVSAREATPGWWRIEVADRGIGVPADQRTAIFEPFHRAPAAEGFPGTGLGLATCRRIIALHGGDLGMTPNPGGGSIFWFTVAATDLAPQPQMLTAEAL